MQAVTGLNHVAIMTGDLERFIAFYTDAFGFEVVFRESVPGMKHAVLRIGAESWLHRSKFKAVRTPTVTRPCFIADISITWRSQQQAVKRSSKHDGV